MGANGLRDGKRQALFAWDAEIERPLAPHNLTRKPSAFFDYFDLIEGQDATFSDDRHELQFGFSHEDGPRVYYFADNKKTFRPIIGTVLEFILESVNATTHSPINSIETGPRQNARQKPERMRAAIRIERDSRGDSPSGSEEKGRS